MAFIHGQSDTRLHGIWRKMKDRCSNPNNPRYHYYGGRGIKLCEEWTVEFIYFYEWAQANGYEEYLTIDRIDVNGNYCPENCRWATDEQQRLNKQNTLYAEIAGEERPLKTWAEIYQIPYKTITTRYYRGKRGIELVKLKGQIRQVPSA